MDNKNLYSKVKVFICRAINLSVKKRQKRRTQKNWKFLLIPVIIIPVLWALFAPPEFYGQGGAFLEAGPTKQFYSVVIKADDFYNYEQTAIYNGDENDPEDCEDDPEECGGEEISFVEPELKEYFGDDYQCVKINPAIMANFGASVVKGYKDHGNYRTEAIIRSRTKAGLNFGGEIWWAYQNLVGDPDVMNDWTTWNLVGAQLNGADNSHGGYQILGWHQTNIRFVADSPDENSIKSLVQSPYFDVITYLEQVPGTANEIAACKTSCPTVKANCNKRTQSDRTYERCMRKKKNEQEERDDCLKACNSVKACAYEVNGIREEGSCRYANEKLGIGDTIYLFKDQTPRIYSPVEDFSYFIDMRGGSSNTLLCRKYVPACGNNRCDKTEDCSSCPEDCGVCPSVCGDEVCDEDEIYSCPADCSVCGDFICDGQETTETCPLDCPTCGDGVCGLVESGTCPEDCSVCGDGVCGVDEFVDCPEDCPFDLPEYEENQSQEPEGPEEEPSEPEQEPEEEPEQIPEEEPEPELPEQEPEQIPEEEPELPENITTTENQTAEGGAPGETTTPGGGYVVTTEGDWTLVILGVIIVALGSLAMIVLRRKSII